MGESKKVILDYDEHQKLLNDKATLDKLGLTVNVVSEDVSYYSPDGWRSPCSTTYKTIRIYIPTMSSISEENIKLLRDVENSNDIKIQSFTKLYKEAKAEMDNKIRENNKLLKDLVKAKSEKVTYTPLYSRLRFLFTGKL